MNLLEFIGFVVSLITLLFLGYRKAQDERKRRNDPEGYEREQHEKEEKLKKFIRSLEGDMDEDKRDRNEDEEDEEDYEDEDEEEEYAQYVPPPPPAPSQEPVVAAKPLLPEVPIKPYNRPGEGFGFNPKLAEYKIETHIEDRHLNTQIESRRLASKLDWRYQDVDAYKSTNAKSAYDIVQKKEISTVRELLKRLPNKKDMVILHEILGLPKGLRQ